MNPEQNQPIFAEGISFFPPNDGSPDWVKGKVSISPQRLMDFMRANKQYLSPKGFLTLDLKLSKDGQSLYFQLNTWKPEQKSAPIAPKTTSRGYNSEEINPEDIPF